MTSKLNTKSPRDGRQPDRPAKNASSNQAASVPISLYRQIAAELQTSKTMLDSLKVQNQQLVKQNQQLRAEIEKVVQSSLHLRQVADSFQPIASELGEISPSVVSSPPPDVPLRTPPPPTPPANPNPIETDTALLQEFFTEQESQPRRAAKASKSSELSGLSLVVAIILTVMVAFGLGFVGLRTFLPSR
jgi:hypothetical protein